MISSFRTFSLLLGFCALTTGCASAPHDAKASVPLVHPYLQSQTKSNSLLPVQFNPAKIMPGVNTASQNSSSAQTVTIVGNQYFVGGEYVSALGNTCRKLYSQNKNTSRTHVYRAICKYNERWQLLNPLVSAVNEKDL